jgi:cell division protein FtsB
MVIRSRAQDPFSVEAGFMATVSGRWSWGVLAGVGAVAVVVGHFLLAAMQGDHGLVRRWQIEGEIALLEARKTTLEAELQTLVNLTARLSDASLDLDLLDERARIVLGYLRADEVVIH